MADGFTHESIDITVDHSIAGGYVERVLEQAARFWSIHGQADTELALKVLMTSFGMSARTNTGLKRGRKLIQKS